MENQLVSMNPEMYLKGGHIGDLLLEMGKLKPDQVEQIIKLQKQQNIRFGDAAVKLGLITLSDINLVLAQQFNYPYLYAEQSQLSTDLVAAIEPFSTQVESLRELRSELMVKWFNQGNKVLSLVGSHSGAGCSFIAANLAIVFSQMGEKTLLIDANLRSPQQHKYFKVNERQGLSDLLAQRCGLEVINQIPHFLDLSVLGAGTIPPNPQELLSRMAFAQLINTLSQIYDVILVDNASVNESSDAQMVTARCGGVAIVTHLNHTKFVDLDFVQSKLSATGAKLAGVVINDF